MITSSNNNHNAHYRPMAEVTTFTLKCNLLTIPQVNRLTHGRPERVGSCMKGTIFLHGGQIDRFAHVGLPIGIYANF